MVLRMAADSDGRISNTRGPEREAFHMATIIGLFKVAARVMDQRQSQRRSSPGGN
jgi:hypothetical protein